MAVIQPIKAQLKRTYLKHKLKGLDVLACGSNGPLSLAGYFSAPTGVGEGARLLLAWLRDVGIDVRAIDLTHHIIPHLCRLEHISQPDPKSGPIIFHVNPPEALNALNYFGAKRLEGRRRIGYWVWELEQVPRSWQSVAQYFHEFMSPSAFSAQALRGFGKPLREVGYPFADLTHDNKTIPTSKNKDVFTVITFADAHSSFSRKNPLAAIRAFQKTFANNKDVRLIIKLSHVRQGQSFYEQMRAMANQDRRVTILSKTLNFSGVQALISSADAMINLHRAEGYGLTIIEALLLGVPVVFTDWSSPHEFKHLAGCYPVAYDICNVADPQKIYKGGRWAEPRAGSAQAALQKIYQSWKTERKLKSYSITNKKISDQAQVYFGYEKFTKDHFEYFKSL